MTSETNESMNEINRQYEPMETKSMEELIQEWIQEDRFLVKYTKRQKKILSKRLIYKLSSAKDRQLERALEEAKEATQEVELKLVRYRKAYQTLLRKTYSTRIINQVFQLIWVFWMTLIVRSIVKAFIASIPQAWCLATELPQKEQYKTLALP